MCFFVCSNPFSALQGGDDSTSPELATPEITKSASLDAVEAPKTLTQEEKLERIPSAAREWLSISDLNVSLC
jgi:hypothetical protein